MGDTGEPCRTPALKALLRLEVIGRTSRASGSCGRSAGRSGPSPGSRGTPRDRARTPPSRRSHRSAAKYCSLSAVGQRRSASDWSISSGVWTFATLRSGDWRHSCSTPSGVVASPIRAARQYSGPAVAVRPGRDLVGHAVLGHGRPEPVCRAHEPVDHEPTVREAQRPQPVRVRQAEPHDVVERGVHVLGVGAAPVAELRRDPLARRTSRSRGCWAAPRGSRGRTAARPPGLGPATTPPAVRRGRPPRSAGPRRRRPRPVRRSRSRSVRRVPAPPRSASGARRGRRSSRSPSW